MNNYEKIIKGFTLEKMAKQLVHATDHSCDCCPMIKECHNKTLEDIECPFTDIDEAADWLREEQK